MWQLQLSVAALFSSFGDFHPYWANCARPQKFGRYRCTQKLGWTAAKDGETAERMSAMVVVLGKLIKIMLIRANYSSVYVSSGRGRRAYGKIDARTRLLCRGELGSFLEPRTTLTRRLPGANAGLLQYCN